jgi:hypothetical protein
MITKLLEIRDRATFIPALAVEMCPDTIDADGIISPQRHEAQRYLLRRCGYDWRHTTVLLTRLSGEDRATSDPYYWGDRTWQVAHLWITEHWTELKDGDVVDVEFILGETSKPKVSERVEAPLP